VALLADLGVEMGIHPSFFTFDRPDLLASEVHRWRSAVGQSQIGGRQHYLRWKPETWQHWEVAGLRYDSSVGYADYVGFRCGSCIPFRPWSIEQERAINLLEIPLIVMDGTLVDSDYMALTSEEAIHHVRDLADRCRMVGGVFTLLCHNNMLVEPPFGKKLYLDTIEAIEIKKKYDWHAALDGEERVVHPLIRS
jgi:hypothetical protein